MNQNLNPRQPNWTSSGMKQTDGIFYMMLRDTVSGAEKRVVVPPYSKEV